MNTLKQILTPRPSVFDKSRRDVVLDLMDLTDGKINPEEFFSENYITNGMEQLYEAVFKRLEGRSDDGIFKLTQAMGGGKTHNMIAIGLLAGFPEYRERVMGKIYKTSFVKKARVVSFTGRQSSEFGIWGTIAEQMGKKELFNDFYSPLKAPGLGEWIKLFQGEPTVILLDELPPYFQNAATISVGKGTLADVTTHALSNLMNAIGKAELSNVSLVISDLTATYSRGSGAITEALQNFENETRRSARNFTPVQQNSDEIYHILRKRLFEQEINQKDADAIAEAYAGELSKAVKMDLTNEQPEKLSSAIKSSYPFHPAVRDLYARFKENPGFQQTRGLIRLMRTAVSNMWDKQHGWSDKSLLIHPYDIDPNDPDTFSELSTINDTLANAISNDIASKGDAAAEKISDEFGNDLPLKTARLLLISSLSMVQNGIKGLKVNEIAADLAAPGIDLGTLNSKVIPELREKSWYLHPDSSGNLLYKNVQNVSAMINSYKQQYQKESVKKEIIRLLNELFVPSTKDCKDCYQKVFVLPSIDQIDLDSRNVALIIYEPHLQGGVHPDLQKLYDHNDRFRNRMLFLTGDHQSMENIYEQARGIKASNAVIDEFKKQKVASNDPQFDEANTQSENYQFKFRSAVTNVFVKLFYPTKRGLLDASIQLQFTGNNYNGEEQIRKTMEEKKKFTNDISSENFIKQIEAKLFAGQKSLPWADILSNAALMTDWLWCKPDALEQVKVSQLKKEHWRENGNWIEIGPFEKPPTKVTVQQIERNPDTGKVKLRIKPVHGDKILYQYGKGVTEQCPEWDFQNIMETDAMDVEFLCIDSKNEHEKGKPVLWTNEITLKYGWIPQGDETMMEINVAPKSAQVKYTTDGSEPLLNGGIYLSPFLVQPMTLVSIIGVTDSFHSEIKYVKVPAKPTKFEINKMIPLTWKVRLKRDSTSESYKLVDALKKTGAKVSGIDINSHAEDWVSLQTSPEMTFEASLVEEYLKFIQDHIYGKGMLGLQIDACHFETGQKFLDLIRELKTDYKENEIEQ
ncbi:MAG: DUF499 domain-containing protein [Bacteroidetes bacterium]|nr:DUF499 domain-containing protein [Bacteroidota bacterium]